MITADAADNVLEPAQGLRARQARVLIVDDHALFTSGLAQILRRDTPVTEVACADSLGAALADLQHHPETDVILLDLTLPGEEGLALLRELELMGLPIPVVVISSRDDEEAVRMAVAAGASGFLCKSAPPAALLQTLKQIQAGDTCFPTNAFRPCSPGSQLTSRQREVLALLAKGLPNKAICRTLDISEHTIKSHLKTIFSVLQVHNRTECVRVAQELGLIGA